MRTISISFLSLFFLLTPTLLLKQGSCYSQDKAPISFGSVSMADFNISSSLIDSNTNAVIIADIGSTIFEGNSKGWFTYIYKRQRRIKILNKKGFDLATVEIALFQNDDSQEKTEKISAVTYNIENGKVTETKLQSKEIFETKYDKNHVEKKFTLPGLKEGSIIEYSYSIKSDFEFNLPSWEFQNSEHPTLWSEYTVTIPGMLSYMSLLQGYHKFYIDKSKEGFASYTIRRKRDLVGPGGNVEESLSISSPTILHRWVMKDLPAFGFENYIASPKNNIDKIILQLYQTYDGESYHDVANNWSKLSEELMKRDDFGLPIKEENNWLDNVLATIIQKSDDKLTAARKIYYYLLQNYTCTNRYNKYLTTTLKDVVKKRSGSVGDINLLLAAMLNHIKIEALPVLLSTREFGLNSATYPVMERLNYVIAKVNINAVEYYLDATTPFLPFGKLPLACHNGHARAISKDTVAVYFNTDSLKEISSTIININVSDKNKIEGSYSRKMGFFESLETKNNLAKLSVDSYKKSIKESYPDEIEVSNIEVDSFQSQEASVLVRFDFKLKSFDNAGLVYFNPMMGEEIKTNPFAAVERLYPVEMPYTTEKLYLLNMPIPEGYAVEEIPTSSRIELNGDEGFFEYLLRVKEGAIQIRRKLVIKKANFTTSDYKTLRDFYAQIVKKESEQIVFKKIK